MAFSATDAALEGFRITRAHPKAVLAWAAVQLVLIALMRGAMLGLAGDEMATISSFSYLTSGDLPAEMQRLMPAMLRVSLADLVLMVVFNAVLYAAVNRAVLGRDSAIPGWLRLGADELRQGLVLLAYYLTLVAAYFVGVTVAVTVLAGLLSALMGTPGAFLGACLGVMADLALVVFLGVRLSLAPAGCLRRILAALPAGFGPGPDDRRRGRGGDAGPGRAAWQGRVTFPGRLRRPGLPDRPGVQRARRRPDHGGHPGPGALRLPRTHRRPGPCRCFRLSQAGQELRRNVGKEFNHQEHQVHQEDHQECGARLVRSECRPCSIAARSAATKPSWVRGP
jgi:hypothetical protein